ncbi:MAG: DivIVA domain-containing protein [Candidatus Nanopelagicales bacterium]
MIALFVVVAMAVLAGVAVLVVRDRPLLVDDPVAGRALRWDATGGVDDVDLAEVRFAIALRGYRMSEVDRVLADTRASLVARDAQLAELRRVVADLGGWGRTDGDGQGMPDATMADVGTAREITAPDPTGSTDRR